MKSISALFFSIGLLCLSTTSFGAETLVFATEATYAPIVSTDPSGKIVGLEAELVEAVCAKMPDYNCRLVNQGWDSLIPALNAGRFDAIFGGMEITSERLTQVDFTEPLYGSQASFLVGSDQTLDDVFQNNTLTGGTIGVQRGTTFEQFIKAHQGRANVNSYTTLQDAILDLNTGRINLIFGDNIVIANAVHEGIVNDQNYHILTFESDDDAFGDDIGIAVRKGNTEVLTAFNSGLEAIKADGTYDAILQKYQS